VAVKIVRQPNQIALLGSPSSAAAMSLGHEGAPAALRAAGLVDRLASIGYSVTDLGDDPPQVHQADQDSPRARNIPRVIAALEALKPRVEQAVKSGALPLVLSGDCSVILATLAGVKRYFRHVGVVYFDRDADLNTPATTSSGCVDGMVISHVVGRGAAELVRFWPEPPLVREPDLALFGIARLDPAEEEVLNRTPLRRYLAADVHARGAASAALAAIEAIHAAGHEFVLHFDVDVIADFEATNDAGAGGLSLDEVREALGVFAKQKHLAAVDVAAYNPAKDPDGSGARLIVELLAAVFKERLGALEEATPVAAEISSDAAAEEGAVPSTPAPGEAWSPDALAEKPEYGQASEADNRTTEESSGTGGRSDDSH
jgi:arginase